jgi:hypothetical protein
MSNWNCCLKQKSAKKELGRSYWFPHTACCPCFDAYDLFCDDAYDWWACMRAPFRAGVCQMLGLYAAAAGIEHFSTMSVKEYCREKWQSHKSWARHVPHPSTW